MSFFIHASCAIFLMAAFGLPSSASSTQEMKVEGSASFLEGKFSGAGLNDMGELVMGLRPTHSFLFEDAAYMLASAELRRRTYYGAGYPAVIVVHDGKSASVHVRFPGDFAVTALAADGSHLFAGTLPSASIYKVDDKGNTTPFADFSTGAAAPNYVWALAVYRGGLYAALGGHFPSVYKMDIKTGKKELLHQIEGKARNVTALHVTDDGIFFGDDAGRVYRLPHQSGAGGSSRAAVLYAFSDAEIRAIASFEGGLAVAANSRRFSPPQPIPAQPKDQPKPPEEGVDEGGEIGLGADLKKAVESAASSIDEKLRAEKQPPVFAPDVSTVPVNGKVPPPPPPRPESPGAQTEAYPPAYQDPFGKGEGNLFWMAMDGSEVHRLWFSQSSIVLSIRPDAGSVWVATSSPGRLYRITRSGSERLYYESTSKDISVISSAGKTVAAAASNPAVFVELSESDEGEYSSKIFDAGFPVKIGAPEVTGAGSANASLFIRSGATADIDSGWTDFKTISGSGPQPAGRFFQVKMRIKSEAAAIRRLRIPYRVQNLYPRLVNLSADIVRAQDGAAGQDIRFQWDVTNLDNDALQYQISYQAPGLKEFIPMFDPQDRPKNTKNLNVPSDQFADGTYRFRLDVTDEPSNGAAAALTHQMDFPLILLDRTPPSVEFKREGDHVRWRASDAASRVIRAEYRVNGGVWQALAPDDGLYDTLQESGRIGISNQPGAVVIDVRSFDERDNTRIYSLVLK